MFSLYVEKLDLGDGNIQEGYTVGPSGDELLGREVKSGFATREAAWNWKSAREHKIKDHQREREIERMLEYIPGL